MLLILGWVVVVFFCIFVYEYRGHSPMCLSTDKNQEKIAVFEVGGARMSIPASPQILFLEVAGNLESSIRRNTVGIDFILPCCF